MRSLSTLLSVAGLLLQGPIVVTAFPKPDAPAKPNDAFPFSDFDPDHGPALFPRADDRIGLRIMPLGASIVNGVGSDPEHNGLVLKFLAARYLI